jgi:hypothetical protein
LLCIHINDLDKISEFFTSLFADDTKLLAKHRDPGRLCDFVNTEFRKVAEYFRAHKLSLHNNKTKFMIFSTSPIVRNYNFEIFLNNTNFGLNDPNTIFPQTCIKSDSDVPAIKLLGFLWMRILILIRVALIMMGIGQI